jgi:hypothetical protein
MPAQGLVTVGGGFAARLGHAVGTMATGTSVMWGSFWEVDPRVTRSRGREPSCADDDEV